MSWKFPKNNSRGFSLVEILVVLGIMAVLSVIAIPSYQTFQARARQKQGLALLSQYYQASQSARAQYGFFPGNFVASGFQPQGELIYRLRTENNFGQTLNIRLNDTSCTRTFHDCDCGGNCPNFKIWREAPTGVVGSSIGIVGVHTTVGGCVLEYVTDTTFNVQVGGVISLSASMEDRHQVNERKQFTHCRDGTR